MRRMLQALEDGIDTMEYAKSISVLQAIHMLKRAWFLVTPTTIANCFRKGGIIKSVQNLDDQQLNDQNDAENIDMCGLSSEEYDAFVQIDHDIECYGTQTDAEMVDEVRSKRQGIEQQPIDDDDEVEIEGTITAKMPHAEALKLLAGMRRYMEENFTDYDAFYEVERMIEKNVMKNSVQRKITDFFAS